MRTNADRGPKEVTAFVLLDDASDSMMRVAVRQMNLSAQAYHRILMLARTIADLAGDDRIKPQHVGEALQYRSRQVVG